MGSSREEAAEAFGVAVQQYQRVVQAFDDAVGRTLGLGATELRCLDWLTDGAMSSGELAKAVGLRPAATTTLVDRLSRRGFVRRGPAPADRRKVLVELTPEGQEVLWRSSTPSRSSPSNGSCPRWRTMQKNTLGEWQRTPGR